MTRPPSRCIFCGSTAPLTDEHVFSHWTHRFLPPRLMTKYRAMGSITYHDRTDIDIIKRPGDVRDWQIRCVCSDVCNNGWMRRVENKARRVMIPLITGQQIRLSPANQQIVATWAVLKAMVAEYDAHGHVTTHHTQRKRMMNSQSISDTTWTVWIGHYVRQRWIISYFAHPFLHLSDKQVARRSNEIATHFNSNMSTRVIGQLFIQIIRSPARDFIRGWRFSTPDKGALYRIWPPTGFSIPWPGRTMTDHDADYVTTALRDFLMRIVEARGRKPPP
jgi:hypothetical protein